MTKGSIDIDDELLREALPLTGIKTRRGAVHLTLELWLRVPKQKKPLRRRGRGLRKRELKN
jgi:Arc/MetJ family transcription regulator